MALYGIIVGKTGGHGSTLISSNLDKLTDIAEKQKAKGFKISWLRDDIEVMQVIGENIVTEY